MKANVNPLYAERKKKFLLVLPLLVLPFVVFGLWILGLVGPETANGQSSTAQGLNLTLPSAAPVKDSAWDKMKFYEQADADSVKLRQQMKRDPYYQHQASEDGKLAKSIAKNVYAPYPESALSQADQEERTASKKIASIRRQLSQKPVARKIDTEPATVAVHTLDVDRLERMMQTLKEKPEQDSELIQMNALMEKIMAVQHPELVQAKLKEQEKERKVYAVQISEPVNATTQIETNRFYSLDEETHGDASTNTIAAVVAENQMIADGAVLKMRLAQAVFANGAEIPENQFIYGVAKLTGNRLMVTVKGVQINKDVLPVNLTVLAADGLEGLPLQRAGAKDVLNNSVDQSTQGLSTSSLGMGIGAEVAGAAVQAGKSLLKKHIKVVTIEVPAGYPVLLKNVQ